MTSALAETRISLGPLQYHWPKAVMQRLYRDFESSPVDIVYLGETICSKRREFRHQDWLETGERLAASGKEIVFSTFALVEAQSELGYIRRLCEDGDILVEANDMSAVQFLAGRVPFVGGPSLNIMNQRTLGKLVDLGMQRWVLPVEMTYGMLAEIRAGFTAPIEYESLAWGRLPLAYSARCYTARAHDIGKDVCGNCCIEYPDGLRLKTRDDDDFLVINGIQTQSSRTACPLPAIARRDRLVDILRISPQADDTRSIVQLVDALRHEAISIDDAMDDLRDFAPGGLCDGYWNGTAGMHLAQ
jgi:collagenase-like PrtC family protease